MPIYDTITLTPRMTLTQFRGPVQILKIEPLIGHCNFFYYIDIFLYKQ